MSQLLLVFFVFSSSFFFFFFFLLSSFSFLVADGTQGLPDQGHKERKRRRKWRKRAKLLLSPFPSFLPTMSIKIPECSPLRPVGRQQAARAARLRRCRPPHHVRSGPMYQVKLEHKKMHAKTSLLLPPNSLSQLSSWLAYLSDSKFCADSKDRSYLMFFIHGGVPFSSIFLRF